MQNLTHEEAVREIQRVSEQLMQLSNSIDWMDSAHDAVVRADCVLFDFLKDQDACVVRESQLVDNS